MHPLLMDGPKIYGEIERQIEALVQTVRVFGVDMWNLVSTSERLSQ